MTSSKKGKQQKLGQGIQLTKTSHRINYLCKTMSLTFKTQYQSKLLINHFNHQQLTLMIDSKKMYKENRPLIITWKRIIIINQERNK